MITKKRKQSVKFESNGIAHRKLIETYIHCNRAALGMEFTTTKRGQRKVIQDGFLYVL